MANTWAARVEDVTLLTATNHGESWTRDELELVAAFTDDATDEEIALTLGRSLYAIWAIQTRIRNGDLAATTRKRPTTAWDAGYDYVTTFPPE